MARTSPEPFFELPYDFRRKLTQIAPGLGFFAFSLFSQTGKNGLKPSDSSIIGQGYWDDGGVRPQRGVVRFDEKCSTAFSLLRGSSN